jgi:hypothetical protein
MSRHQNRQTLFRHPSARTLLALATVLSALTGIWFLAPPTSLRAARAAAPQPTTRPRRARAAAAGPRAPTPPPMAPAALAPAAVR